MSGQYERYIIRKPDPADMPYGNRLNEGERPGGKTGSSIYLSQDQIPECNLHMNLIWIFDVPSPNPYVLAHTHPYNETLFFIGTDPDNTEDLGGEVDLCLGGETYTFTTTTAVYVPKGLEHCPITYRRVDRPQLFIALSQSGQYA